MVFLDIVTGCKSKRYDVVAGGGRYFTTHGCCRTWVKGNRSTGFFLNNCDSGGTIRDVDKGEGSGKLTLRIRSAASGDTESGMRKSTLQILRYVATVDIRWGRGVKKQKSSPC